MLWELRVRDLGVIDDVTVELGPGMTALTGETGAGKTLVVHALSLLLGGRADPSMVRAGAAEALVEGRFAGSRGPGGDDEVVLARSVAPGRSRAWVDGRMVPAAALAERAAALVELHGQHQHRTLVVPAAQRQALDQFGEVDTRPLAAARARLHQLEEEAAALGGDAAARARQADLLRYQIDEIERAAVAGADEDGELAAEEDRLASASAVRAAAGAARHALTGGDDGDVGSGLAAVSALLAPHAALAPFDRRVRSLQAEVADLVTELRSVEEEWEDDPERLADVRARRQLLVELCRKYGPTLADVLAFADGARSDLAGVLAREDRAGQIDRELVDARSEVAAAAAAVGRSRRTAAPVLGAAVEATLRTLALPGARFTVEVGPDDPGDAVVFGLGANTGEPVLPLARVASGGELSRTMLALRLALTSHPDVLVFDEVDTGVGGAAAQAVGAALARLAASSQVLVVTHLPQVAAYADHQVAVVKHEDSGRTRSAVVPLDAETRVVELARMLSGSPESDSARRHARELLAASNRPRPAA